MKTKTGLKLIVISMVLFFIFELFLKLIGQYNIISFLFGGINYMAYSRIAEEIAFKGDVED